MGKIQEDHLSDMDCGEADHADLNRNHDKRLQVPRNVSCIRGLGIELGLRLTLAGERCTSRSSRTMTGRSFRKTKRRETVEELLRQDAHVAGLHKFSHGIQRKMLRGYSLQYLRAKPWWRKILMTTQIRLYLIQLPFSWTRLPWTRGGYTTPLMLS